MAARIHLIQSQRGLAAQAATQAVQGSAAPAFQVSQLPSGLTVASLPGPSPVAHLGLAVKTGSRFETHENPGIASAMKLAYGLSGQNVTSFGIARNVAQAGGSISVDQDRECTLFQATLLKSQLPDVMDYFLGSLESPPFKTWEVNDQVHPVKNECLSFDPDFHAPTSRLQVMYANLTGQDKAMELLYKGAFRDGLGNYLHAQPHTFGSHNSTNLKAFYNKTVTNQRSALIGIGVDHHVLEGYGKILNLENGEGPKNKTTYFGGEERRDNINQLAHVALAGHVGGFTSKDMATASILCHVLVSSSTKWGTGMGKVNKAVGEMGHVSPVYNVFSDAGILGAAVTCDPSNAGQVVEAIAKTMRAGDITAEEVEGARKQVLLKEIYDVLGSNHNLLRSTAWQFTSGAPKIMNETDFVTMVKSTTVGDVQALAKKLSSGKLSMGAYGNVALVPYLDTL